MKLNIIKLPALSLLLFMAACSGDTEKKTKTTVKTETLKTMTIEPHTISQEIQLPGVLEPFEWVQIFPKVNGFIKEVYVDRGSKVRKGQVLVRLEAPELEQNLSAAKLKYMEAQSVYVASKDKYNRLQETSRTPGTVSPYDLSTAHARMAADSATVQGQFANYKAQKEMENYLTVTAPFDGVITERNVHPGALTGTQNGKPMLILQQQSKLRMVINVPEEYSTQVQDKNTVHFHISALPGEDFTGTLARSSGSLSDRYRSEAVEVDIANADHKFIPGMYAEVVLPASGNHNAFVVPRSSVVTTTERKYVVAVRDDKTKWIDITEGNQMSDSTEVFGQLHTGDKVVVNASYKVQEGTKL